MLAKFKSRLAGRSFVRSVALVAGGTALGQLTLVLVSPILSRLYTPEDFGALSVFIAIFSLLLISNSLRYELAIPLAEDDVNAANLVVLVVVLVAITTVVFGVLFALLGDPLLTLMNATTLKPYLGLLLLTLFAGGLYQALNFWGIRKTAFRVIARSKVEQGLGMALVQLLLGLLRVGTFGLLAGVATQQIAGNFTLLRFIWREDRRTFQQVSLQGMLALAKRFKRFPLLTSWSSFLMNAGLQLPPILIVALYGAEVGGWYALGQRVIGLPMALIGTSVGQVYVSRASQLANSNRAALPALYSRTARQLLLIGLLPIGFLALTGPWLFAFIFGESWRVAGEFTQIIAPLVLAQFVVSSVGQNIYVIERQDLQSTWDILRLTVVIGTFALAAYLQLSPHAALAVYAAGGIVLYIISYLLNRRALRQFTAA